MLSYSDIAELQDALWDGPMLVRLVDVDGDMQDVWIADIDEESAECASVDGVPLSIPTGAIESLEVLGE